MNIENKTGGNAFPTTSEQHYSSGRERAGMNLLDYFAAKAMQAHISYGGINNITETFLVSNSYKIAAAMIEERKKYI